VVAFVGFVVVGYSVTYLARDPQQHRFLSWMALTLASVLALVTAGDLVLILAAWVATSLCLHKLLLYYPGRPGAVFAARKKFVISRMGDACLLSAVIILRHHYGTTGLSALFEAAGSGDTGPLQAVGILVAACACLKSAQFPFHSWLPDTMEAPTPVSAFMHAGIINAGGFLIVRLSPLLVHAPVALAILAFSGAVTAGFGAVVMLTTPTVKRSLAYSTIAQMGFMLLECGVGAFGLAVLHLAGHSLYKAHAFLNSGSTVGAVPRRAVPLRTWALVGSAVAALGLVAASLRIVAASAIKWTPGEYLLQAVLWMATSYGLARAWSAMPGLKMRAASACVAALFVLASNQLQAGAKTVFGFLPAPGLDASLAIVCGLVFAGLFLFQSLLWRAGGTRLGRSLYVHALNGFYVGSYANRLTARLWPQQETLHTN
jgi:NAD(P)H-quinone oxidoreductase subunit 5